MASKENHKRLNKFHEKRGIAIVLFLFFSIKLCIALWAVNKGFDIGDEGFYLLSSKYYQSYETFDYFFVFRKLFWWLPIGIIPFRLMRIVAEVLGALILSYSSYYWALSERSIFKDNPPHFFFLFSVTALGGFMGMYTRSFSYNELSNLLVYGIAGILMLLLSFPRKAVTYDKRMTLFCLAGLAGFLCGWQFFVKFPAGILLLVCFPGFAAFLFLELLQTRFRQRLHLVFYGFRHCIYFLFSIIRRCKSVVFQIRESKKLLFAVGLFHKGYFNDVLFYRSAQFVPGFSCHECLCFFCISHKLNQTCHFKESKGWQRPYAFHFPITVNGYFVVLHLAVRPGQTRGFDGCGIYLFVYAAAIHFNSFPLGYKFNTTLTRETGPHRNTSPTHRNYTVVFYHFYHSVHNYGGYAYGVKRGLVPKYIALVFNHGVFHLCPVA